MLGNKKFNMIISIILAISLWAYVVGEINPTAERTIKDVAVRFAHSDVLAERGLAMSDASAYYIDVAIEGSRSEISKIDQQDISAVIDLATASKGENELNVSAKAPDGISISKKSMSAISVKIESLISKEVPVNIHYSGKLEEPKEGETISKSFDKVKVSGAESNVKKVKAAVGTINALQLSEQVTTNKCNLVPVDKNGHNVGNVWLSKNFVSVESIISKTKEVDLNVEIINNSTDDMTRKAEYPKKIVIAGRSDTLKEIESVDAEAIDISNAENGKEFEIKPQLPEGIMLSERHDKLFVKVSVDSLSTKNFSVSSSDIVFEGKTEGLNYRFDRGFTVDVTVSDKKEILDTLRSEDLIVVADVSSIKEAGHFDVKLSVKPSVNLSNIKLSQNNAAIVVN